MKKLLLVLFVLFLLIAPRIAQANSDNACDQNDPSCVSADNSLRPEGDQDLNGLDDTDDKSCREDKDKDDEDKGDRDKDDRDDDDRDDETRDRRDKDKDKEDKRDRDRDKDDRDDGDEDDDDDEGKDRDDNDDDDESENRDRDKDDDDDDDNEGKDRDRDDDDDDDDDDEGEDRDRDDDDDDDEGEDRDDEDDDDDEGEDRDGDDDDDDDDEGEDRDRDDDDDDDDEGEDRDEKDKDKKDKDRRDREDDDDDDGDDDDEDEGEDDDDGDKPDDDDGDEPDDDDDDSDDRPKPGACRTIKDGGIFTSNGEEIVMGFDRWGYNYHAHKFNGWYENADRQGTPVETGNIRFKMKWNDIYISNKDCDRDGKLDRHWGYDSFYGTRAWLTNHYVWSYVGDDGNVHWVHWFLKMVAQPHAEFDCASIGGTPFNGQFCTVKNIYYDPYGGSQSMSTLLTGLGFGGKK